VSYRGRFAPSPTGPLHFGSLVAAVASYLCARQAGGAWLVRIEDLDPPREMPGAADAIVKTLDAFGFQWNESILRQSSRTEAYREALDNLLRRRLAFPCSCSRSELQAAQDPDCPAGDELHYPGWCRDGVRAPERPLAIRLRVDPGTITFDDLIQGPQACNVSTDVGDFVIRRRDGLFAYQLAVVVDDAAQAITHVVRGTDLLGSTGRQILLQRALGFATPEYAHMPVVTDANGVKLSKSQGAAKIDPRRPSLELWRALRFLQQAPPDELRLSPTSTLWKWAVENWRAQALKGACAGAESN
jgi:glutamyl-Q tRNA(Asp) synthetase